MNQAKVLKLSLSGGAYNIHIGCFSDDEMARILYDFFPKTDINTRLIPVLCDKNTIVHAADLLDKFRARTLLLELNRTGEDIKSLKHYCEVCEIILSMGVDRRTTLIAFGGGTVGDLTGFVASTILRGIDFIQVPTTLLSMVDSSIGGKTGVNSATHKNMIGAFYQPKLVICNTSYLRDMPERELLCGYAEILKYGFVYDRVFFNFCINNFNLILRRDSNALLHAISESCRIKAAIVERDPLEKTGLRATLNFGHTLAHAFEKFPQKVAKNHEYFIKHGEAVGLGMMFACVLSSHLGLLSNEALAMANLHFQDVHFWQNCEEFLQKIDAIPPKIAACILTFLMSADKKNSATNLVLVGDFAPDVTDDKLLLSLNGEALLTRSSAVCGQITFVLLKNIGEPVLQAVDTHVVYNFLLSFLDVFSLARQRS